MDKYKRIFIICLLGFLLINLVSCKELKYQWGRDTYDLFGDGTYQIDRVPNIGSSEQIYALYDCSTLEDIEMDIYRYTHIEPYVYVVGASGYTILNYQTGELIQKMKLEDLPKNEQQVFAEETDFKTLRDV